MDGRDAAFVIRALRELFDIGDARRVNLGGKGDDAEYTVTFTAIEEGSDKPRRILLRTMDDAREYFRA